MSFFDKLKNSIGVEEAEEPTSARTRTDREEEEEEEKPAPARTQKIHVKGVVKKAASPSRERAGEPRAEKSGREEREESSWFEPEGELAVDVYQTNGEIVIQSTIAGVNADELDIAIENDIVTISGERRNPNEEEDKSYFYQECYWGPFSRQIILPEEIDTSRIEASMKDGVFTLRLPKLERQKVKRIKVRS